ncbi:MAG TPA: hypothetical protein VH650_11445 [Gaiellaceae bacterium]
MPSTDSPPSGDDRTDLTRRLEDAEAELDALRTAHEAQARFLVQERLALADEIEREMQILQEEIDWRTGVMEHQQEVIEIFQNSRSLRYTEPFRKVARAFRRS